MPSPFGHNSRLTINPFLSIPVGESPTGTGRLRLCYL